MKRVYKQLEGNHYEGSITDLKEGDIVILKKKGHIEVFTMMHIAHPYLDKCDFCHFHRGACPMLKVITMRSPIGNMKIRRDHFDSPICISKYKLYFKAVPMEDI